jgi:hypothetical protein
MWVNPPPDKRAEAAAARQALAPQVREPGQWTQSSSRWLNCVAQQPTVAALLSCLTLHTKGSPLLKECVRSIICPSITKRYCTAHQPHPATCQQCTRSTYHTPNIGVLSSALPLQAYSQRSDHLAAVAAYNGWVAARAAGGRGAAADFVRQHFVSEQVRSSWRWDFCVHLRPACRAGISSQ